MEDIKTIATQAPEDIYEETLQLVRDEDDVGVLELLKLLYGELEHELEELIESKPGIGDLEGNVKDFESFSPMYEPFFDRLQEPMDKILAASSPVIEYRPSYLSRFLVELAELMVRGSTDHGDRNPKSILQLPTIVLYQSMISIAVEVQNWDALQIIGSIGHPNWPEPLIVNNDFYYPDALQRNSYNTFQFNQMWIQEISEFLTEQIPEEQQRIEALYATQLILTLLGISTDDGCYPAARYWTVRTYLGELKRLLRELANNNSLAENLASIVDETPVEFRSNISPRLDEYDDEINGRVPLTAYIPDEINLFDTEGTKFD